jgi:hypothetical protein
MADKKKAAEGGSENDTKATDKTAKKKAAPPEVAAEPAPRMKSTKIPKLAKKNKSRLPRREKKAGRKAEAAQGIQSGDRG